MSENESLQSEATNTPKKGSHTMLLVVIGMLLGLVALVALNMN